MRQHNAPNTMLYYLKGGAERTAHLATVLRSSADVVRRPDLVGSVRQRTLVLGKIGTSTLGARATARPGSARVPIAGATRSWRKRSTFVG